MIFYLCYLLIFVNIRIRTSFVESCGFLIYNSGIKDCLIPNYNLHKELAYL